MNTPDFRDYLGFAERYSRLAQERQSTESVEWLLIPSIILSWTAVESFVNNRLDDYRSLPNDRLQLHERAFLSETRVGFVSTGAQAGTFQLERTEYRSLEDKILFLLARFANHSGSKIKDPRIWQRFADLKEARDRLVHPRIQQDHQLTVESAGECIEAAKEMISLLSKHLWGKEAQF